MVSCQHCGTDLPTDPRWAVEEDAIDEVVAHIQDGDEPFAVSKTDYYCDPECAAAAFGGGD